LTAAAWLELPAERRASARSLFLPDRPGPLTGLHVIATGLGRLFVDSAEAPRVALASVGFDAQLAGDPAALAPEALRASLREAAFDAPSAFEPLLRAAFAEVHVWPRVISRLGTRVPRAPAGAEVRRLARADAAALAGLDPALAWIHGTNGGPERAAASGLAFGAFVSGRLASVALPFLQGERFEELGVVTEPAFRRRGLSAACASALAADVRARGREPSWSTAPSNEGSLAVARALGATREREDVLWLARGAPE
jgi:GNAT superfamily N-acetyltransferase